MPRNPRFKPMGPRMASGKFVYNRKSGARPERTIRRKATTTLIKQVLNRQLETKYVAQQVQLAGFTIPGKIQPSVDYHTLIPDVVQQTTVAASNTREGDKIEPLRAKVSGHIWYDNLDTTVGNIVFVKLFFVTPKNIKSASQVAGISDGLLESGTADPSSWTAARQDLQAFFPVCKENYTLLKTKTFKLVKNGGLPIGNQETHSTNIGKDRYSFSYSWKPPTLKYDTDASQQPSNHLPLMFCVAYSPGYNYDTDASLVGQVKMNWNIEMFYKDA